MFWKVSSFSINSARGFIPYVHFKAGLPLLRVFHHFAAVYAGHSIGGNKSEDYLPLSIRANAGEAPFDGSGLLHLLLWGLKSKYRVLTETSVSFEVRAAALSRLDLFYPA
jgi:hypothetical protein